MSATAVALSALAMHASSWLVFGCPASAPHEGPEMTNAPTQTGRGARIAPAYAGACLVLLRGPPGQSRTFNRFLGDRRSSVERVKDSLPPADQPKRCDFGALT